MKQRTTRELFQYWNTLRGDRPMPDRCEIDPGAIRLCLPNTFILAVEPEDGHPFRIAGTAICNLFARELTGTPFAALWAQDSRRAMADVVSTVSKDTAGLIGSPVGRNAEGETVELELILLPLTAADCGTRRLLGAFAIVDEPYWIGVRPIRSLHAGPMQPVGPSRGVTHPKEFAAPRNLLAPGFVMYRADEEPRNSRKKQG